MEMTMIFKRLSMVLVVVLLAVSFCGCKKFWQSSDTVAEAEQKQEVDCSMFVPPWGDEFWESWGKANPAEFEDWYVEIIPKMSKVTLDDIKACSHLDNFFLGFSNINTLEPFAKMKQLRKLDLRFSPDIKDLTPLQGLEKLQFLSIWKTGVTDLTPISKLPELKTIDAKVTEITDLTPLKTLTSLESIDLLKTKIEDISVFKELKNLKIVVLCSIDNISDISVLYPIAEQITYIDLCNTKFTDFESLRKFKNLERLKLWGIPIKDASLFSEMENLWELDIWNTKISDLSPLFNLKNLKRIVIAELEIDPEQIEKIKENNPGIEIVESF
jgi:internalin A